MLGISITFENLKQHIKKLPSIELSTTRKATSCEATR
jgi:hypothetical protein